MLESELVAKRVATILVGAVPTRLLLRRGIAAGGLYLSVGLGFLGTVIAARRLSEEAFGLFSLVLVATGFFQSLFDLTTEEALVKYGFRYSTRGDWGRLRRLYEAGLLFKACGASVAGLALIVLAPLSEAIFGSARLTAPLMVASVLPLLASVEGLAGAALYIRGRYDVRSAFLSVSMGFRLAGIAIGVQFGLLGAVVGVVVAQAFATLAVGSVAFVAFRRFPQAPAAALGSDRREILRFVLQSSAATGVLSLRGSLAPVLLGVVTSPAQVGYFRVAQAPQQGLSALSGPARMILLTEQTRDWERGRQSAVLAGVRRYSAAAAALMAVALPLLLWFMPDLIRLVYTSRYLAATNASRIFACSAAIVFVFGWTKSFPVTIGRPGLRIVTHGLEALVVLPLVLVLGSAYGATGAAVAVLAGTAVFALAWLWLFSRVKPEDIEPLAEAAEAEEIEVAAL
jgi:O-antigen/teichoic acid export membrane protein